MKMLLPGGSSMFDLLLSSGEDTSGSSHAVHRSPTPADLGEALAQLRAGRIEYVILEADDGTFVQTAGDDRSGFQLERWANGAPTYMGFAPFDEVTDTLARFLGGDASAGLPVGQVPPPVTERPKQRRWFRRG